MLSRLIDSVVSGEPTAWGLLGLLWVLTAIAAALQRSPRGPGAYARVFSLLALATASAAVGIAATHALSIPRLTWRPSVEPAIVRPVGTSWRVLRGPPVPVTVEGLPDIGVPALDPEGRWVLYGLLSGEPVPGLRPAEPGPREGGALRICDDQDDCRPWPADWPPTNAVAATMELRFAAAAPLASLAYDVEYRRYLVDDGAAAPTLELEGRFTNGPNKAGPRALFVLRRLAFGRFEGLRVVATADEQEATFRLDRAHANLTAAGWARRWIAEPLLFASLLMLPAMAIALLLAPRWLRASMKRRGASLRDAGLPVMIVPEPRDRTDRGLAVLATDATLGDAALPAGTVVRIGFAAAGARSVVSQRWLELPPAADEPPLLEGVRPVGTLIPADPAPFARAARLWLLPTAHVAAVLACGLSIVAPALVALTSLLATR